MPVYEFICRECKREFEEWVRTPELASEVVCPKCGGRKVERQLSVFAARQGHGSPSIPTGGCGRCGDPHGPCTT